MKIREVCDLVGVSRATIYRLINHAEKPFPKPKKIGAVSRWSEAEVVTWIEQLTAEGEERE